MRRIDIKTDFASWQESIQSIDCVFYQVDGGLRASSSLGDGKDIVSLVQSPALANMLRMRLLISVGMEDCHADSY